MKKPMNGNQTVGKLLATVTDLLSKNGCESAAFDATCILEDIGQIGRGNVHTSRDMFLPQNRANAVLEAAKRRSEGYPLQYLLGSWDFLGLTLAVGEGVLIPRPETELLCEEVGQRINKCDRSHAIHLWDLCAGTGCVGLGIASLLPDMPLSVTEVELSEKAMVYLEKNINTYEPQRARLLMADVLHDAERIDSTIDVLVSNPPYIPTGDLPSLQKEVQCEPAMALDGSEDGLLFYRTIAEQWFPKVTSGGIVAVEIGIGQTAEIFSLFSSSGLSQIEIIQDFSGIDRVVLGTKT